VEGSGYLEIGDFKFTEEENLKVCDNGILIQCPIFLKLS
jgi:hypothetical protein